MDRVGAGDGNRTRDTKLGKLVLYQLSYARVREHPELYQNWFSRSGRLAKATS